MAGNVKLLSEEVGRVATPIMSCVPPAVLGYTSLHALSMGRVPASVWGVE